MTLDHHIVRRLAFVRYLFQLSVSQSQAPAPLKCAAILTAHDAVELWLHLASQHLNVGKSDMTFMGYFELLNRKLAPRELSQKESMRRLNEARVGLKHHGIFPLELEVEEARVAASSFFRENTPSVFGLEFDGISLIEYVNPEAARMHLFDAQAALDREELVQALDKAGIAYAEMIHGYEARKRSVLRGPLFPFGPDMPAFTPSHLASKTSTSREELESARFIEQIKDSIQALQDAMKVLALGIDYWQYSKFRFLTPRISRLAGGGLQTTRLIYEPDFAPARDDVLFCIDFVVEVALHLDGINALLRDQGEEAGSRVGRVRGSQIIRWRSQQADSGSPSVPGADS